MASTRDGRPHRWVNIKEPGATVFVTATCLDFVHAFRREEIRDLATRVLLEQLIKEQSVLHAFVVMSHHIHLVVTCREDQTISQLVQQVKSKLALRVAKELTEDERSQFYQQAGLNRRTFWKPSFRGTALMSQPVFLQKLDYIHLNPVRAGYVELSQQYRWSSKQFWEEGLYELGRGLPVAELLARYR